MNGNVFQCYEERRDPTQYTKTMDTLHAYAKRDLKTTNFASLFAPVMRQPTISMPTTVAPAGAGGPTEMELLTMKEEGKHYVSQTKTLKADLAALHAVAWGQCSKALKAKIKTLSGYQERMDDHDCVWLFSKIASVSTMQKFEETRHHAHTSMITVLASLINCCQQPEQKVTDYVDCIRTITDTIEHHGGCIGDFYYAAVSDTDDAGDPRASCCRAQTVISRPFSCVFMHPKCWPRPLQSAMFSLSTNWLP